MVAERKAIDIEGAPVLEELTRELERHPAGLELRRAGQVVATITGMHGMPLNNGDAQELSRSNPERDAVIRPMTEDQLDELLRIVERIAPNIDANQMHRNVEESRRLSIEAQLRKAEIKPAQ